MKYQWKESSTCQAQLGLIVKWDIRMIECCQQIETLRWTKSPTITVWISKLFFILITLARSMWSTDFSSSPSQSTHIIDMQRTLSGYNNLVPIAICCCILILVAISRKEIQPILIQIRIRSGRLWGFHWIFMPVHHTAKLFIQPKSSYSTWTKATSKHPYYVQGWRECGETRRKSQGESSQFRSPRREDGWAEMQEWVGWMEIESSPVERGFEVCLCLAEVIKRQMTHLFPVWFLVWEQRNSCDFPLSTSSNCIKNTRILCPPPKRLMEERKSRSRLHLMLRTSKVGLARPSPYKSLCTASLFWYINKPQGLHFFPRRPFGCLPLFNKYI